MTERKVALVSGASRGLGYALAREAARRDYHVLALSRRQELLDELADRIEADDKGAITVIPGDITDDAPMRYMAQSIFERFRSLDLWFHTALFTAPMQPVAHLTAKDLDKALAINLHGTARLIHILDPILRNTEGARAVFFDEAGIDRPNMANLSMSKLGQMTLARQWQAEAQKFGPKVEILTPPPMRGAHRGILFPGEDANKLADPADIAVEIFDKLKA